jgi:hypothetical protein
VAVTTFLYHPYGILSAVPGIQSWSCPLPVITLNFSVPDPDLPDPHVFGPPGSFYQQAKIVRKTLISTVLLFIFEK